MQSFIREICSSYQCDPTRLVDIVRAVQERRGCVSEDALDEIAELVGAPRVEVESVVSFYSFFTAGETGRVNIRLCNDVIDRLAGVDRVAEVFCEELGIGMGETTADGAISLDWTPCIGMSDQAPAALINDVVMTELSTDTAREIVQRLRKYGDPKKLVRKLGMEAMPILWCVPWSRIICV